MLGNRITCCTHVNLLSGVQDMHSSLCGHSLDRRNKARGLVSRRAEAIADRTRLLQQASQGCIRFELNQPPWKIESDAKQMGMGFYW